MPSDSHWGNRRVERFRAYLDQVSARLEDVVPAAVVEAVKKRVLAVDSIANTGRPNRKVIDALRSIDKGFQYCEYWPQIAAALTSSSPPASIPDDLRAAMVGEFERVSSEQVHRDACENPDQVSLPPMHFVARKLAIELGADPEVIALFPESSSRAKRTRDNAYWVRLRNANPKATPEVPPEME